MRVLVTGASGVLGRAVVSRCQAAGLTVRALVRPTSDTRGLDRPDIELATATLCPPHGLADVLRDVDAVVHCAGGGRARTRGDLRVNNLDTTAHLMEAVQQYAPNLTRFVFISSLSAQGPSPTAEPPPVSAVGQPITLYGRCKAEAEALVQAQADQLPVTLIRPPAIYGPGDWRLVPMFRAARRGWVPIPASARTASLIHVDDCAAAVVAALTRDHPSGRIYTIAGGPAVSYETLVGEIGAAVGTTPAILRIPRFILWLAGLLGEVSGPFRARGSLLNLDKVRDLCQPHWVCGQSEIEADLGWKAEVTLASGLEETAIWYRDQGLLE